MPVTPSKLDRSLRLFTDVRAGEGATALLMFANVFLVLCAYYFIKPLREGWIAVSDVGGLSKMEVKAYSSFGQTLLLIPAVWGYARLSARFSRTTLITRATLFCMSNMFLFWLCQPDFFVANLPYTGILFYLWVGIFGLFIVAQFWTFAADLYTDERGRRLLPLIAIGATAGAACGSWITETLVNSGVVEPNWLLIAAMLPLTASIALTRAVERRGVAPEAVASPPPEEPPFEDSGRGPLEIVFSNRLLIAAAGITLLVNWVNTNGENLLFRVVQEHLHDRALSAGVATESELIAFTRTATTAFYGDFFFWVNASALLLQAFVASRLLKYGGFAAVLMMLPVVALISYSAMALIPILGIIKMMKVAENATDYSINNTARHVLWLPVSPELTYKGKPTIDTLFARIGDGIAAVTVLVGVQLLALPTASYFVINVGLVVVWIALALVVVGEHRRLSED